MINRTKNKKLKLIKSGSPKGTIALHCFDCSGHDQREVRTCDNKVCALWIHRPRFKPTPEERAAWEQRMIDWFVKDDDNDLDELVDGTDDSDEL